MSAPMTVTELIAQLSDYDPESPVHVMYESSTWVFDEEAECSNEVIVTDWTRYFQLTRHKSGAILLGTEIDTNEALI